MEIKNELIYREYLTREEANPHGSYSDELSFYHWVKTGNVEMLATLKGNDFTQKPGLGSLSENKLQSAKYHFAIAAAMISRYCIEAGMEYELAYTASDMYINKADQCENTRELSALQYEMSMYYTNHMRQQRTANVFSLPITKCIEYIYDNLHTHIHMKTLTKECGLSEGYLSRLFKKETGKTISSYIRDKRLDTAKNMLTHSDYPMVMISDTLCFASQSHFIDVFRKNVGMTPAQYRKQNSRKLEI